MKAAVWRWLIPFRRDAGCHSGPKETSGNGLRKIAIVGNPNVGKSVVFNRLTGRYVTISNYPGTTVDISRGKTRFDGHDYEVIDTPGMYSFNPITEEERVARAILISESPDVILHVVDAKNIERMLPLTLQLIDAGLPVVLQLNMMDEADDVGIDVDNARLEQELGIPVVATTATTGYGMERLRETLATKRTVAATSPWRHNPALERWLSKVTGLLSDSYRISRRSVALLLLQGDVEITAQVRNREGAASESIAVAVTEASAEYNQSLHYVIALSQRRQVHRILARVVLRREGSGRGFASGLSRAMMNPLSGGIILAVIIYLGLYQFVGVFAAGTMVDFIESIVFGEWLNPRFINITNNILPWQIARDLFVGEYGIFTLGLSYAFAIIFPIVGTFSLVFAVIEDSGYLPRLAMLIDRVFKGIGLNGRAVIPLVLGFGCDTMATIVTRTQETKRERVITTLLLALAIPCSAQLGVIFGIMSASPVGLAIWAGTILLVFLLVGFLAAKILPGENASFYMEVPPLRLPRVSNVLAKTMARLEWYFVEILPLFILASVVLWAGDLTGVFDFVIRGFEPLIELIGVPGDAAVAFLYGFFRRDFGAAGLYDLNNAGVLTGVPLVVSAVTITLFVPCVAQFVVMVKERGVKTALAIGAFILPFAFVVGYLLNLLLTTFEVTL